MNNEYIKEAKLSFPLLNQLSEADQKFFFDSAQCVKVPKNLLLLKNGDACQDMIFILHGSIRVYKLSEDGGEITLYRLTKGDTCILNVSCIMNAQHYNAMAETEEETIFLKINGKVFKEILHSNSLWQEFIFKKLSDRLSEVMMIVEQVAFQRMDKRLALFILEHDDNGPIQITHETIALELGTAREVISRLLKNFEKQGMIKLSRGSIQILNRHELEKF